MPKDPRSPQRSTIDEMTAALAVERVGDRWVGTPPTWFGDYLFGGFVVGQATAAAIQTAPPGRRLHSLHAYFLKPVGTHAPVEYGVDVLRAGRTFATHRLDATQDEALVFTMTFSFTADTGGYEYELPLAGDVPGPDELTVEPGPGPFVAAYLGPSEPDPDGTRASTHRAWFRVDGALPDDPAVHAAYIAFATDWTGTGGRPLHLEGDVEGMVSLDHAVWFHRPLRADAWTFFDVHSLVNTGGRGLLRGTMHDADRRLSVSVAQEMLLRPVSR
ncbi:MAG TPA: acyl-CoA thioesterase domain-containing protein [Acidimicrobiia bacterium]|nr:acyl-CoA thioesterase domain-containing protein [Acidimicrobiia bacterium]